MATSENRGIKRGIWSRRDFFGRLGWLGFGVFSLVSLFGFMRSAFPRVLFKPPSTFKAGFPSDYAIGEVSEKFKKDFRVWIVREEAGLSPHIRALGDLVLSSRRIGRTSS